MMTLADYIVCTILITIAVSVFSFKLIKKYKGKAIQKRGVRGEAKALILLEQKGYRVLKKQMTGNSTIYVDGQPSENIVRADFLVQKAMKKYIVEVKTGKQAKPTLANVRRQMLEYMLVFDPDGMLFVDIEKQKISEITFDKTWQINILHRLPSFLAGLACGLLLFVAFYVALV